MARKRDRAPAAEKGAPLKPERVQYKGAGRPGAGLKPERVQKQPAPAPPAGAPKPERGRQRRAARARKRPSAR
jgi:hypothetical protein